MASSRTYLDFVLEQLSELGEITYRPMMGEFLLYYRGRIVGGIYDDRLLVKPVHAAKAYLPDAPSAIPYAGAKAMLLVEDLEDRGHLAGLLQAMYEELPAPRRKK